VSLPSEFKRFPSHWKVLPFLDAVKDSTSKSGKIPKSEYKGNGEIPIVDQGKALFAGYTNDVSLKSRVASPAIIFGDHTRAFKYIEGDFCLGADGVKVLEPKAGLDKRFLYHYLNQLNIESAGYSRHFKFLKETYVPVPPLKEQKRIAAILDKADGIRRKRQQAIQLADDFLRSVFLDMFGDPVTNPKGWDVKSAKKVISIQGGYAFKSADFSQEGTPIVKIGNANKVGFTTNKIDFIQPANPGKLKQYELFSGDLLMSLTGTVGKDDYGNITEVNSDYPMYYLNQRVAKISLLNKEINKNFLKFYFQDIGVKAEITKNNRGVRQANISNLDIYSLYIPTPDKAELERFDKIVKSALRAKKLKLETIKTGDDFFLSLSQKAFSGKL